MIRKIVLAFVVLFVLTWIILAHMVKSKVISLISDLENENIKISYSDASIAGFPFGFTIRFASPKITLTNHVVSRELSAEHLNCIFNYNLRNANLEFGKNIHYSTHSDNELLESNFRSEDKIEFFVDFLKTLYKYDDSNSVKEIVKNIDFISKSIVSFNQKEEELYKLSNIKLNLDIATLEDKEEFALNVSGNYQSSNNSNQIKLANVLLEAKYDINKYASMDDNLLYDRKLDITKVQVNLDDTSCTLSGFITLNRNSLPHGKISVELFHYDDIVDIVLPDDFIFSKPYVKQIIAKAASIEFSHEISDKVNFDINFTDNGISLGMVNLFHLNDN